MSSAIEEGRATAEAYNGEAGDGFKNVARKNAYECDGSGGQFGLPHKPGCGSFIVTIDRETGVTPFIVRCGNCGGEAHSKFYRVQDWLEPTHEWYRPESTAGLNAGTVDHIRRGGLILRPIPGKPDEWQRPDETKDTHERMAELKRKLLEAEQDQSKAGEISRQLSRQERRYRARKGGAQ